MRLLASAILSAGVVVAAQSYPPPFPRQNAVKLLDNDRVQVWNVVWPKGQPTPLHRHIYDVTGVYIAPGDRLITALDGSKRQVSTAAGGIVWQFKGLTHVEEGTSDAPLRAVMIELKQDAAGPAASPAAGVPAFAVTTMPALDNERITAWDYTPAATASRHQHVNDAVVVWLEGSTPHVIYIPRGTVHDRENIGTATHATVFELKSGSQPGRPAAQPPTIAFESSINFLKYSPDMNLGEVLGVAVNSKGHIVVLNHPGSAGSGPLYGNASTQLLEFDQTGRFVREIGKGVYGLGYSHGVRFDKYDNLWVVDKGTNAVVKFNPAGYVTMNLGRRPEGPDDPAESYYRGGRGEPPVHVDGMFRQPTDVAWDSDDNIYISDGYTNSRVAKFDKHGNWITSWGSKGSGGAHADENPGQFNTPHNIGIDRQNNIYVADRGNRRIQVFDTDGKFLRLIRLNVPYDKTRHPVLGNLPANRPDETQPWTICITNGPTQYLYTNDQEPGRLYKLTLDGRIVGMLGESGRDVNQFNWVHGLACPSEDVLFVADMNNWRVQKLTLHPARADPATR